ncbi:MAG: hypothetical protein LBS62_03595 [Clostridiales bacterium]|jgi:hypothetical protein|nr:hypothetical protein [Clostridiales bacterium]
MSESVSSGSLRSRNFLLQKLFDGVINIFSKGGGRRGYGRESRFKHFLTGLHYGSEEYINVAEVVYLCDEAYTIARQRLNLMARLSDTEAKINELDAFFKLDENEVSLLKELLARFVSLGRERSQLMYQLASFNPALRQMIDFGEDAERAVTHIQHAEKSQRLLRHDLGELEGEKLDLEYEKDKLNSGLDFINKFAVVAVTLFGAVSIYLAYKFMLSNGSIFIDLTVLVLLIIAAVATLHTFRRRMVRESRINTLKQRRAVELLNKKRVVYAYYTNFLDYEYKKYKVRNSQMLKANLKELANYKHVTMRIDAIRKIIYETESTLEKFLREKKINNTKFTIEQFANTVNIDDKIDYCKELAQHRLSLEKNLAELDGRHKEIWGRLEVLNKKNEPGEAVMNRVIQAYLDELNELMEDAEKAAEIQLEIEAEEGKINERA